VTATEDKDRRRELSLPETSKIAALLADLMPPGPNARHGDSWSMSSTEAPPALVTLPIEPPPASVAAIVPEPRPTAEGRGDAEPHLPTIAADPDLIPLGDLTVSGYFSIVNWSNEPKRERHPRRNEYGLDEASLELARRIPFYVTGQARAVDRFSVAAVRAQFVWE